MKYNLSAYEALIFDFDGTILDSETYKIATFKSLFAKFPKYIDQIDTYNRQNRGITRYEKFEYIYRNILKKPYTKNIEEDISRRYATALAENLHLTPLIEGIVEFLNQQKAKLFIASSSPPEEILKIIRQKKIISYFTQVYGYPMTKTDSIKTILKEFKLHSKKVAFFGDALVDLEAAKVNETNFIGRTNNPHKFPSGTMYISSFRELLL